MAEYEIAVQALQHATALTVKAYQAETAADAEKFTKEVQIQHQKIAELYNASMTLARKQQMDSLTARRTRLKTERTSTFIKANLDTADICLEYAQAAVRKKTPAAAKKVTLGIENFSMAIDQDELLLQDKAAFYQAQQVDNTDISTVPNTKPTETNKICAQKETFYQSLIDVVMLDSYSDIQTALSNAKLSSNESSFEAQFNDVESIATILFKPDNEKNESEKTFSALVTAVKALDDSNYSKQKKYQSILLTYKRIKLAGKNEITNDDKIIISHFNQLEESFKQAPSALEKAVAFLINALMIIVFPVVIIRMCTQKDTFFSASRKATPASIAISNVNSKSPLNANPASDGIDNTRANVGLTATR